MHLRSIYAACGLIFAGVSSAFPTESFSSLPLHSLVGRALTTDNTCGNVLAGNNKNLTCDPALAQGGACCSASGYCGSTTDYCGTGCQATFGTCSGSEVLPLDPNMCGPANGNNKCLSGLCCSGAGYCGNTTAYCQAGCQSNFGVCTATTVGSGQVTCGPAFGNAKCDGGNCCSAAGYCGVGKDYCSDPDCQWQYGTCDSSTTPAGTTTLNDPRPLLGGVTYDNDIYDCTEKNVVALTYDDGPYLYTSQLLDTLKQFGFHATFFMTGNNLGKGPIDVTAPYPSLIQRMVAEGHQVASHTWSHYSLSNITHDERMQQMVKNERAIANIIGKYPTYMRPPYSQCDVPSGCQADMKALGYHRVYFDLDTQDYLNPLPTQIHNTFSIAASYLSQPNAVDFLSIQHDIVQQSATNFSNYYFGLIQQKGWKGVTAGECLGDAETNWYRTPGAGSSSTSSTPISLSTALSTTVIGGTSTTLTSTVQVSTTPSTTSTVQGSSTPSTPTTTSTSTTSSKSSTSVAVPTATPTCVVQSNRFCGTILPFGDKAGCQKSAASCYSQYTTCAKGVSKQDRVLCDRYLADCQRLNKYCGSCGFTCSSTAFNNGAFQDSRGQGKKQNED